MPQFPKSSPQETIVLVRGIGDVGSAIICELKDQGFIVIAHEDRKVRSVRRKMSFTDVVLGEEVTLEGTKAAQVSSLDGILEISDLDVPVYGGAFDEILAEVKPDILIDSRINKTSNVDVFLNNASLTIGVGPGFVAKQHCDVVIESCWGDELGKIIREGHALPPVIDPPLLEGMGWERFVRAPVDGIFSTDHEIGQRVQETECLGFVDEVEIRAPISGHLRGLLHSGIDVVKGEKLIEIDPRGKEARFEGLAERPKAISTGVLSAIIGDKASDKER